MFGWLRGIGRYIYDLVYPQPPQGARYGFRWQSGQGVPNAPTIYDLAGGNVPAGIYVTSGYQALGAGVLGRAAGTGATAGVEVHVRDELDTVHGNASFRPPAIGVAHELMHAMHYTRGTAPGLDIGNFTTTAAELLFVGITPFQDEPVSENEIRARWSTVANPDPSNVWANPTRRTTYDPPMVQN